MTKLFYWCITLIAFCKRASPYHKARHLRHCRDNYCTNPNQFRRHQQQLLDANCCQYTYHMNGSLPGPTQSRIRPYASLWRILQHENINNAHFHSSPARREHQLPSPLTLAATRLMKSSVYFASFNVICDIFYFN